MEVEMEAKVVQDDNNVTKMWQKWDEDIGLSNFILT